MKLIFLTFAVLSVAVAFSYGALPENVKTSAKQLSPLERHLIRTFHPKIKLNEILAQEKGNEVQQDDYIGSLEFWNLELPILFMQLAKMGDEILLPTFQYEYGFYFCFIGVCDGFLDIYNFRRPVLKNVNSTSVKASVNGTQIRVEFKIPDVQILSPEYTLESHDYGQDYPSSEEIDIWQNGSIFLKNFTLEMTANVTLGSIGLQVSNFDLVWNIDDLRVRYENGTHIFPGGRSEELGAVEDLLHEQLMENWRYEGLEEYVEGVVPIWLNCFLTNGRSGDSECDMYLNQPLHRQSFAEIIHAFGLAGLKNIKHNDIFLFSPPSKRILLKQE